VPSIRPSPDRDRVETSPAGVRLGQAEVEDLEPTLVVNHQVAGLQVPVNHASLVSRADRIDHRYGQVEQARDGEPPAGDDPVERDSVGQFHDQETPSLGLFDRVDRDDVRVGQGGDRLGLVVEPLDPFRILARFFRKELDCDRAPESRVDSLPYLAHPAFADLLHQAVMKQGLSDRDWHRGHSTSRDVPSTRRRHGSGAPARTSGLTEVDGKTNARIRRYAPPDPSSVPTPPARCPAGRASRRLARSAVGTRTRRSSCTGASDIAG